MAHSLRRSEELLPPPALQLGAQSAQLAAMLCDSAHGTAGKQARHDMPESFLMPNDSSLSQARHNTPQLLWKGNNTLQLQHLAAASAAGTSPMATQQHVAFTLATRDVCPWHPQMWA
ncbi:hypothetical protein QJQ45_007068 [Haematococcus lacustris]|nr:hypothetical protein QJQ45_007068 [Haematococcus lacustris]